MNVVQEIKRINEQELQQGVSGKASWHHEYKDSAWVFAGGFPLDLTEGDILCVMSQWGEIEDINLCREKDTGKSKGFCFVKYEDQKSTILAVDNFNGIQLLGRTLRVDHKHKYSLPKEVREREDKLDEERIARGEAPAGKEAQWRPGVAYEGKALANSHNFHKGVDVFAAPDKGSASSEDSDLDGGGGGGDVARNGESAEEKHRRREAKRARKEARRTKREHKEHKKRSHHHHNHHHHNSGKKENEDSTHRRDRKEGDRRDDHDGDDHKEKKHKKKHKRDEERRGNQGPKGNSTADDRNSKSGAGTGNNGDSKGRGGGDSYSGGNSRADTAGAWERGARAFPGGGAGASFGGATAAGRVPEPPPLSTGNVMDWRGLGGRGGGRGERGGGRNGGRGRGRDGRGRGGGGGAGDVNSYGGMDRRR